MNLHLINFYHLCSMYYAMSRFCILGSAAAAAAEFSLLAALSGTRSIYVKKKWYASGFLEHAYFDTPLNSCSAST